MRGGLTMIETVMVDAWFGRRDQPKPCGGLCGRLINPRSRYCCIPCADNSMGGQPVGVHTDGCADRNILPAALPQVPAQRIAGVGASPGAPTRR